MQKKLIPIAVLAAIAIVILKSSMYTIDETEQVIVTKFGKVENVVTDAGLHFKIPGIQQINRFDKRILEWDGKPTQVPTHDKKYIWVDTYARWRIDDPLKFFQRLSDERSAHDRLDGLINGAVRNQISNHDLIDAVRSSNRPMLMISQMEEQQVSEVPVIEKGRDVIVKLILAEAKPLVRELGIELVDIRIKRINYTEQARNAVYERMIVERKRIAAKYRSEGEGEMMEIYGKKEREEKTILSGAYKQAQEIMGKADAEAINIYASAYSRDPEFYSFLKTLESYEENLGTSSTIILSTGSDYLKYLKGPSPD